MATAEITLAGDNSPIPFEDLLGVIKNLPPHEDESSTFNLRPVTYHEVFQALKTLRADCSTGPDLIPTRFIKLAAKALASPLTNIINNSISKSIFPSVWKVGLISPIPKIDNATDEGHFRPISIFLVLSKVPETLVARQIVNFIELNQSLKQTISGFRKGHSTTTVLLRIRDDIIRALKKGELTLMVLADYSKAFDIVSYSVIIHKMWNVGFSKPLLSWMTDYLCDRWQYVQIDDKESTPECLQFGVPSFGVP